MHSENFYISRQCLFINYTDLLLVVYLHGISSCWPVTQVQNYPWWVVLAWNEQCQVLPYKYSSSSDFKLSAWLKVRDFEKSPFSKVIKFRESTEYTGARFLNFHFCILFNHNGPERQQATGWNVQQCQQHNIFWKYTDISNQGTI